jgi:hypothetical protein
MERPAEDAPTTPWSALSLPMTVRGGGVPIAPLGFHAGKKNGSAASELRRPMRMSASWFGSWTHRIQGRGAIDPSPESGLPSDRHPDRTKRAVVLEAVKVWPGKGGVCSKVGATANLDSSCARRLHNTAGRGEETVLQVEQRNRSKKQERKMGRSETA